VEEGSECTLAGASVVGEEGVDGYARLGGGGVEGVVGLYAWIIVLDWGGVVRLESA